MFGSFSSPAQEEKERKRAEIAQRVAAAKALREKARPKPAQVGVRKYLPPVLPGIHGP